MKLSIKKIRIIGLGQVGSPQSLDFGKKHKVLGYDFNQDRIDELNLLTHCTNVANLGDMKMAIDLAKTI